MAKQKVKKKKQPAIRVSQLAKKTGRTSSEIVTLAQQLGLGIKSHTSSVSKADQKTLLDAIQGTPLPVNPEDSAPLSMDEIREMAPRAMAGLAVRCAMRVMPLIRLEKSRGVIEEEQGFLTEVEIAALIGAGVAMESGKNSLREASLAIRAVHAWEAKKYPVSAGADAAADRAFHAVIVAASCVERIVLDAARPADAKGPSAEESLAESLRSSAAAVRIAVGNPEAAHTAARADYRFLREQETDETGHITPELFMRPLWPSGIPEAWEVFLEKWKQAMEKFRCPDSHERHMGMLDGKGIDWEGARGLIDEWVGKNGAALEALPAEAEDSSDRGLSPTQIQDGPSREDLLGRDVLVEALASMFKNSSGEESAAGQGDSFIVGLLGGWGVGKSSVMRQLKDRLQKDPYKDRFLFAEFNAWEYEHTGNIAAGMAQEVVRGLVENVDWRERWRLRFQFAKREYRRDFARMGVQLGLAFVSGILAMIFPQTDFQSLWRIVLSLVGLGTAGVTIAMFVFIMLSLRRIIDHPIAAEFQTYLRLPNYGRHLGLLPVLQRHIKTLCKLRLSDERRLVLFVDDMDRCRSDRIAKTLDAVRLVMNVDHVIVAILVDHRIAFEAAKDHYAELADEERGSAGLARDYLGKIIQLPVRLREPSDGLLRSFISGKLFPQTKGEAGTQPGGTRGEGERAPAAGKKDGAPAARDPSLAGRLEREMENTFREREDFTRLALKFQFRNPRRLLRLRNAYRLLKLLNSQQSETDAMSSTELMTMLFWQEFLHGLSRRRRNGCMAVLWGKAAPEEAEFAGIREILQNSCGEIHNLFKDSGRYAEVARFVRTLVLPHGEEGITDTPEELDDWVDLQSLDQV